MRIHRQYVIFRSHIGFENSCFAAGFFDGLGHFFCTGAVAIVVHEHIRAGLGESGGDISAETFARAGNQCFLPLEHPMDWRRRHFVGNGVV